MSKILYYRKKQNITQTQLAEALGVTQAVVSLWETGEASPKSDRLPSIAKILGCAIDDLFEDCCASEK